MTITIPRCYNDGSDVTEADFQCIERTLAENFGGYSRIEVAGAWVDDYGKIIYENCFRYEIITGNVCAYEMLKAFAKELCAVLIQDCILTTCEQIEADFISQ